MVKGKLVFRGTTKKGLPVEIRYVTRADTRALRAYINEMSKERTFISWQGEQCTLAEEKKAIEEQLRKTREGSYVRLLVTHGDTLIGTAHVELGKRTFRHAGELGVTVRKQFRGKGVGELLMRIIIKEAQRHFPELRLIVLDLFATNRVGYRLYRKLGFIRYGYLPGGTKLPHGYVDHLYMYKRVHRRIR